MKILIVDDHELFRTGLQYLLRELSPEVEFRDLASVQTVTSQTAFEPDLVLLDYHLPDIDGADAIANVLSSYPTTSVVVMSGDDRPELIRTVLDSGASGFIPKSSSKELLMQALKLVLAGGIYLPQQVLMDAELADSAINANYSNNGDHGGSPLAQLSSRQRESILLAIRGASYKTIAKELDISEGTVKAHLSSDYKALGVRNRPDALLFLAGLEEDATNPH